MLVIDITGQKFGRLTVLGMVQNKGNARAQCQCDCGKTVTPLAYNLKNGTTRSCGCLATEEKAARIRDVGYANRSHGKSNSRTYVCWQEMKKRCLLPTHSRYAYYGAQGITVCDRWLESFENFLADMGECPAEMTLDRRENHKGYEPGNCEWASRERQAQNRQWNKADPRIVREIRRRAEAGETAAALAREFGMCDTTAGSIIKRRSWKNID